MGLLTGTNFVGIGKLTSRLFRQLDISRGILLSSDDNLSGSFSLQYNQELADLELRIMSDPSISCCIIDLGGRWHLGLDGIELCIRLERALRKSDGELFLSGVTESSMEVLTTSNMAGRWRTFKTIREAMTFIDRYENESPGASGHPPKSTE